jgi:2Fe-2S ferredoxin
MGGQNPYIQTPEVGRPTRPFTVTYVSEESGERTDVRVDPKEIPYADHGLPGSILDIAEGAGVEINHSCGGVCACSTCHVYVTEGGETCPAATDDEEDMLDEAPAVTSESRLSCQCVPNGTKDLIVVIPKWNRNQVSEAQH